MGTNEFALDFRKIGLYRRVDVGIDPYELFGNLAETNKTATTELPAVAAICFCSVFLLEPFADGSCSLHAGCASLRKASGYARAVTRRKEAGKLRFEVLVELEARRVELDLRAVENNPVGKYAGN